VFGDPKEDTQLQHSWRLLQEVHALYYATGSDAQPPPTASALQQHHPQQQHPRLQHQRPKNVAGCLASIRGRCLSGCSLVFSGLLPRGLDPRRTDLGYMATALGASVTEALAGGTTHVVAENPSTEKVYHARQRGGAVEIVTRAWLQLSFWHCERKPEAAFRLLGGKGATGGGGGVARPSDPLAAPGPAEAKGASADSGLEERVAMAAEKDEEEEGDVGARASKRVKMGGDGIGSEAAAAGSAVAMEEAEGEGEGGENHLDALEAALADELG
jgi:RNA polymerase II subunit A C-terminal domain phosphatase